MPINHKKLIGKSVSYRAQFCDEDTVSIVTGVDVKENVCGDLLVWFMLDNGETVDDKTAFFSRSDIALARSK